MKKINSIMKLSNNSSFVILVFAILKFRNIDRFTFRHSEFWLPPMIKFPKFNNLENTWNLKKLSNTLSVQGIKKNTKKIFVNKIIE